MSFILDALRKLEEKRTPETGLGRLAVGAGGPLPAKRPVWLWIAAGAFMINIVVFAVWLMARDTRQTQTVLSDNAVRLQPEVEPAGEIAADTGGVPVSKKEESIITASRPSESVPVEGTGVPLAVVDAESGIIPEPERAESIGPSQPVHDLPISPVSGAESLPVHSDEDRGGPSSLEKQEPSDKTVLFDELPAEIRKDLQDLIISGHIYSDDPSFRFVAINDNLKREGESVLPGLNLEEITVEGVVFTYRGHRFYKKKL